MTLSGSVLIATLCLAEAAAKPAEDAVTYMATGVPLRTVLEQLARTQDLTLIISYDVADDKPVSLQVRNMSLTDALRVLLTPIGYSFEIESGDLLIFVRGIRTYRVLMPSLTQSWTAEVSNEASGEGGGSQGGAAEGQAAGSSSSAGGGTSLGARVALVTESKSDGLWDELEETLKAMLGKDSSYSISRTAGLVTVRDRLANLDMVGRYIDALNLELSQQAVVEVRIAEVSINDEKQAGINWNVVWNTLLGSALGDLSIRTATGFRPRTEIAAAAGGNDMSVAVTGVGGATVLRAIEAQGRVDLIAQPQLLVGNNLPSIIQAGRVQAYISRVNQTIGANTGFVQTSVQTSVLNDGLILSLLPRINGDGTVTLAVAAILQDILEITQVDFQSVALQLPTINRRSYSGVVRGKIGETIVLAGLLSDRKQRDSSGIPWISKIPIIGILFGTQGAVDERTEVVILLTLKETRKVASDAFMPLDPELKMPEKK